MKKMNCKNVFFQSNCRRDDFAYASDRLRKAGEQGKLVGFAGCFPAWAKRRHQSDVHRRINAKFNAEYAVNRRKYINEPRYEHWFFPNKLLLHKGYGTVHTRFICAVLNSSEWNERQCFFSKAIFGKAEADQRRFNAAEI
jgi:hypothetical protein